MKTLDEVIESITKQSGLEIRNVKKPDKDRFWVDRETYMDALYYLKEYRKLDSLDTVAFPEDDNPAMTWDELKQMEGKPVWVEDNIDEPEDTTKYWAIYRRIEKTQETEYALLSDFYYDKAQYGETWQAYRKEKS